MKKIFALVVIALICWGVVTAQTPDSTMVCDLPTVLDTIGDMPVCPTFGATVATQTSDGSVLVTTPLLNYNPGLVYHTGIVGSDSMYFTVRVNTSSTDIPGSDAGSIEAVYDSVLQQITCTIITSHVTFNARYDFTPHLNVTGYCNTASGNYMTVDGPDGYVVTQVHCPSYGDTTVAVRNADGSVTVTHQLVGYSPAVLNPSASPRFFGYDSTNMQRMYSTDFVVSDSGLMTCTFPASNFTNYPSHNMYFKPKIYLASSYCSTSNGLGPSSNGVCIPYDNLPSFSGVSNTWGVVKFDLFTNEGVILKAKIEDYSAHANQIAKMGF